MPSEQVSVFICYSRRNSSFVDKLEADLKMRNFSTWVDREKTEGSQAWKSLLTNTIDTCDNVLIVLSPAFILSRYVSIEYDYIFHKGKKVIALDYQYCQDLPIKLKNLQRIGFMTSYEQGLGDLLDVLGYVDDSSLKPNYEAYFEQAQLAQKMNDWRKAAGFWQVLQEMQPRNTVVSSNLEQCLREQGTVSAANGQWDEAISAWEALLKIKPYDVQALRQLDLVQLNHIYEQYYVDAKQSIEEDDLVPGRMQLHRLWSYAPYYGDPEGLAQKVGITKPLQTPASYEEEEKKKIEQTAKEEEYKRNLQSEKSTTLKEQPAESWVETAVPYAWAGNTGEAIQKPPQKSVSNMWGEQYGNLEQGPMPATTVRGGNQRQRPAITVQKVKKERRSPTQFINYTLETSSITVWWSFLCLLTGLGLIAIIFIRPSQLWPSATLWIMTIEVLLAILVYFAGYHKAMGIFSTLILTAISVFIVFIFTRRLLPELQNFNREQKSQFFFLSHTFWMGKQISAGLIIGSIIAFCLFFLIYSVSRKKLSKASFHGLWGGAVIGLVIWTLLSIFAWFFNWGWGFGPAWYWSLFGVAIGVAAATGLGASLIIWAK